MPSKQSKIERSPTASGLLKLVAELDQILETEVHRLEPAKVPKRLFHYTTVQGLHGIVGDAKLHATNLRFMNDRVELEYGIQVVRKEIEGEARRFAVGSWQRTALENCREMMGYYDWRENSALETRIDFYGVCFCEDGDSMPLWKSYARDGVGYALGFAGSRLDRRAFIGSDGILVKVIYDAKQQEKLIRAAIRRYLNFLAKNQSKFRKWPFDEVERELTASFNTAMSYFVVGFKHPSFAHEREWRFIQIAFDDELGRLAFKMRGGSLVPYFSLEIAKKPLPLIAEIVHGPGAQQYTSAIGLQLFLATKNLQSKIKIRKSTVPLVAGDPSV